jgi:hypothetical protein
LPALPLLLLPAAGTLTPCRNNTAF